MIKQKLKYPDQLLNFTQDRLTTSSKLTGEEKLKYDAETSKLFEKHVHDVSSWVFKIKKIKENLSIKKDNALSAEMKKNSPSIIFMSNALINASHSLELNEKRIMAIAASKIYKGSIPNEEIEITVKEYKDVFKISEATAYSDLMRASKTLSQKYITWADSTIASLNWVDSVEYDQGHSKIRLKLSFAMIQNFQAQTEGKFTQFNLKDFAKMNTVYAQRLYELLMQYADTGKRLIKVNHLIFAMDAPETYLNDFSITRERIITPSIKRIEKIFKVKHKERKRKGQRKITSILFSFAKQQVRSKPSAEFEFQ